MKHVDAEKLALNLWDALRAQRYDQSPPDGKEMAIFGIQIRTLEEMRARSEHWDFAPERKVEKNPLLAAPYGKSSPIRSFPFRSADDHSVWLGLFEDAI